VNVKDFGAAGDGIADDAQAFTRAAAAAVARRVPLVVPGGTYRLATRPLLALNGLELRGAGFQNTVLRCEYPGPGIVLDAFAGGDPSDPFIHVDVVDLTIQGNSATTSIFLAQGIHRSTWRIRAQEADPEQGIAFDIRGCMSNTMNLQSSVDLSPMRSTPREGIRMSSGVRGGTSVGNSTNNTVRAQIDGLSIGIRLLGADQSLFEGGYAQSNSVYGLVTAPTSRFNLFVATAFENPGSKADVADGGESNRFINCYSTNAFLLQGRMAEVVGGVHERIQVDRGAVRNRVHDLTVNHFQLGSGGFYDLGTATESSNVLGSTLTASFDANVMTVTEVNQGAIRIGQLVSARGIDAGTTVAAYGSGLGGPGTYLLSTEPGALASRTVQTDGDVADRPGRVAIVSPDRGDTSQTLRASIDAPIQRWATDLTADRTITLSTDGARGGETFRIVRTGRGRFTLDVGGLKAIPAGTAAFVDVAFDGAAWVLTGYGEL
jgi:hypothetical protein